MLDQLAANLAAIRERIAAATAAAGREPGSVTLVAVTKYADDAWVGGLHELGVRDFGEARSNQLAQRVALLPADVRWHFIGTLQRRQVAAVLDAFGGQGLIHSVDSLRLATRIATLAAERGCVARALVQVNITGEASKHGFSPDQLRADWSRLNADPGLQVDGLMAMAAARSGPDDTAPRQAFDTVARLREELAAGPLLSIGMSGDFEDAIAAGATHVRVGSALFEGL